MKERPILFNSNIIPPTLRGQKLTQAQRRTLEAVSRGDVSLYEPIRIGQRAWVSEARVDVIKSLEQKGLIKRPAVSLRNPSGLYTLTDEGRSFLEKSNEELQSQHSQQ